MKTLVFNLIIIVFSMSVFTAKADYVKTIHKGWPSQRVKALSIESKFSDIKFISTRDDSVTIDVSVKIKRLSKNNAEYLADQIKFRFSLSDGTVYAKTEFGDKFKTKQEFNIEYTINIPADRNLDVENRYGNVTLGDLRAKGNFDISYGNIQGQDLQAPDSDKIKLELKYGNASFDAINNLYAEIGYGKLFADEVSTASFESKYSILNIDKAEKIVSESKYDHYEFETVDQLKAESKFTGWNIDRLKSSLTIETQYGDIDVDHVSAGFQKIDIENSYGNIVIGIPDSASYQLEGECYYCKIKFDDNNAEIIKNIRDNNHNYIKANVGNHAAGAEVKIDSRYGKVNLLK